MVKPQFEVGKERLGKGGVVRDLGHRADAVDAVAEAAARRGWGARAVTTSPLPGPVGQRGVLPVAACRRAPRSDRDAIEAEVARSATLGVPGEKVNP